MAAKKTVAGMEALKAIKALDKPAQKIEADPVPEKKRSEKLEPVHKSAPESAKGKASPPAGANAVARARAKEASLKMKTIGLRVAPKDLDIIQNLAHKLMQHGLQYSEANAIRVALRSFDASDNEVARIAEEIMQEDGRRNR